MAGREKKQNCAGNRKKVTENRPGEAREDIRGSNRSDDRRLAKRNSRRDSNKEEKASGAAGWPEGTHCRGKNPTYLNHLGNTGRLFF